jgi:hypothetical protein
MFALSAAALLVGKPVLDGNVLDGKKRRGFAIWVAIGSSQGLEIAIASTSHPGKE